MLSREQMKKVMGGSGGSSGWTTVNASGSRTVHYGVSQSEAMSTAAASRSQAIYGPGGNVDFVGWGDGHWCCSSCGSIT